VMQRFFLRRFASQPLAQMMMTMGFALLFRDVALIVWGGDPFTLPYPRALVASGPNPPKPRWPGGARIALQFVLNYEEGGENSILHGDAASEAFLSEIVGAQPWPGMRHWNMESIYEYGARAGVWRRARRLPPRPGPRVRSL